MGSALLRLISTDGLSSQDNGTSARTRPVIDITVAEKSAYQATKEVKETLKAWTGGQRASALQTLLEDHFASFPKKEKLLQRLEFLAGEFGTVFEVVRKGKTNQALRKASLVRVLDRLALYLLEQDASTLNATTDEQAEVAAALEALAETSSPQITLNAQKVEAIRASLSKVAKGANAETSALLKDIEALLKTGHAV